MRSTPAPLGPRDRAILRLYRTLHPALNTACRCCYRLEVRSAKNEAFAPFAQRLADTAEGFTVAFENWTFQELSEPARDVAIDDLLRRIGDRHGA